MLLFIKPMTKGKQKNQDSEEVARLKAELKETIRKERHAKKEHQAKQVLRELEAEYERSKEVFFKVNGARRILKNA